MKRKEDKIILDENPLTKVIMVRIKTDSFNKLKKIAEKECRTVASVVRQAIKGYLEKK